MKQTPSPVAQAIIDLAIAKRSALKSAALVTDSIQRVLLKHAAAVVQNEIRQLGNHLVP